MRRRLVAHLRRRGYLRDRRIGEAFLDVPREVFLPEEHRRGGLAGVYRDDAIVTRRDPSTRAPTSSSSQPAIMAMMLEMLAVEPGHRVLEIGAGTGYNAAILDHLAGPDGLVVTVDLDVDVAAGAARALWALGSRVHVVVADGAQGMPGMAPRPGPPPRRGIDRMMVTASSDTVPRAWHEQLDPGPGSRLVVPLRLSDDVDRAHAVTAFVRVDEGFDSVAVTAGGFMPLRRPTPTSPGSPGSSGSPGSPPFTKIWPPPGSPGSPEPPSAATPPTRLRGPLVDLARNDVSRLRIVVRYGDDRPASRWVIRRDDHWLGVDRVVA